MLSINENEYSGASEDSVTGRSASEVLPGGTPTVEEAREALEAPRNDCNPRDGSTGHSSSSGNPPGTHTAEQHARRIHDNPQGGEEAKADDSSNDPEPTPDPHNRFFRGFGSWWGRVLWTDRSPSERIALMGIMVTIAIAAVATPVSVICTRDDRCPRVKSTRAPTSAPTAPAPTPAPTTPGPTPAPTVSPAPTRALAWRQIQVLEGDTVQGYQYYGYSVGVNQNGTAVAIGAWPTEDGQSFVEAFYQPDPASPEKWEVLGNKIYAPDERADSVFLSDDASKLVVFTRRPSGIVRIFSLHNDTWHQDYIWTPETLPTRYGTHLTRILDLHVSPDCSHMATVLRSNSSETESFGQVNELSGKRLLTFYYAVESSLYGKHLGLSRSGRHLVVARSDNSVSLYRNDSDFWWEDAHGQFDGYGTNVAISGDGRTVAIANTTGSGMMTVFRGDRLNKWNQLGNPIIGATHTYSEMGENPISISDDGSVVGIGDRVGTFNPNSWFTSMYFNGNDWEPMASVWDANTDEYPCALSGDGSTLCCGSPYDLSEGFDAGLVTIYRYER